MSALLRQMSWVMFQRVDKTVISVRKLYKNVTIDPFYLKNDSHILNDFSASYFFHEYIINRIKKLLLEPDF